jgi:hypothetical protein
MMSCEGAGGRLAAECEKGMILDWSICIPVPASLSDNYIYGVQSKKKVRLSYLFWVCLWQ